MVSKVFEKLPNNRFVNHLKKCNLFLISSMVLGLLDQLKIFWQLYLIELLELLTGLGLLKLQHLIISKAFDRVWHVGLLHKLNFYGISGQIFGLISSFLSNKWLQVVLDGKSSQKSSYCRSSSRLHFWSYFFPTMH